MVSIPGAVDAQQAEDAVWGMISGSRTPSLSFSTEQPEGSGNWVDKGIGTSYTGLLAEAVQQVQVTDFTTKQPRTYPDGNPIYDLLMILDTDYRDPANPEDQGRRALRFGQGPRKALQEEMKRLNIKKFGLGTRITLTHVGYQPNPKGGRSTKTYSVSIEPTQYVPVAERQTEQALAAANMPPQGGAQQQWAQAPQQYAQPAPQQQYVQPANPAFPGQVVPQQAPAQVSPLIAQQVANLQALQAQVPPPQQAAPQAPAAGAEAVQQVLGGQEVPAQAPQGNQVTQQHIDQVNTLMGANIPRDAAISAVVDTAQGDAAFRAALDGNIPF